MNRFAVFAALVIAAVEISAIGCNSILGNQDGILQQEASTTTLVCGAGEKACGACVDTSDPKVGCGGPCSACTSPTNAQSACALENDEQTCSLGACNAQFGNCDNDPSNGCETHTTTKENCGECGKTCSPEPFCEPDTDGGAGYFCSQTCDAPNEACPSDAGPECIDPQTDGLNCGMCGTSCAVKNGTGVCTAGHCVTTCDPGKVACVGRGCVAQSDDACGTGCTDCTLFQRTCDLSSGACVLGGGSTDAGGPTTCSNGGCGTSCEVCGTGSRCNSAVGKCICETADPVACVSTTTPAEAWCCTEQQTCSATAGQCVSSTPSCTPPQCLLPNTNICGCGIAECQVPTRNFCGPTCTACVATQCCCPNGVESNDGGSTVYYTCVGNDAGAGGPCPAGCN